jgi:hypothetical protein
MSSPSEKILACHKPSVLVNANFTPALSVPSVETISELIVELSSLVPYPIIRASASRGKSGITLERL